MIKIAFIDLDGTLLNDKLEVSEVDKNALILMHKKGVVLTIVTGRSVIGLPESIKKILYLFSYIITSNGGIIYDNIKKRIIFRNEIHFTKALLVVKSLEKKKVAIDCLVDGVWHINKCGVDILSNQNIVSREVLNYILDSRVQHNDLYAYLEAHEAYITKIAVSFEEREFNNIKRYMCELFGKCLLFDSDKAYKLDLYSKKTTKGNGCSQIINFLNIKPEEAISFGNDNNDISMFNTCKCANIAMENAIVELKRIADYICKSNNDNGVNSGVVWLQTNKGLL